MKSRSPNIITILLIITSMLTLGFFREFIFKNINALLKAWDFDLDYQLPALLQPLENYEYDEIVNFKWLLTLLFALFYLVICIIAIKLLFNNKNFIKITIASYAGIILISGLFMLCGLLFPTASERCYEFARYLMGMVQSPLVLMILVPAFKLSLKENTNIKN